MLLFSVVKNKMQYFTIREHSSINDRYFIWQKYVHVRADYLQACIYQNDKNKNEYTVNTCLHFLSYHTMNTIVLIILTLFMFLFSADIYRGSPRGRESAKVSSAGLSGEYKQGQQGPRHHVPGRV